MIDDEKADFLQSNNVGVSWSFDGMSSNDTRPLLPLLENTNPETGEVIRQMPSPELLKIAQSLPKFDGLFLNRKA